MSTFNLNEYDNTAIAVFNNGAAGKVENVSITIEKKKADEPDSYPPYKLVVTDGSGGTPINQGFYFDESDDEKRQTQTIQRIKSIAKAILPEDFVYPTVNSYTEAVNSLFKIIKDNCDGKKVNVFVTYGYVGQQKLAKYLGLRMFNFIEETNVSFSRLKSSATDIMERPIADAPIADAQGGDVKKDDSPW
jgi:hypothetical protein